MFVGDPGGIRQILINLIGNAIKFTESGGIVVSVRIEVAMGGVSTLFFAVDDTGIGIPEERQHAIFEPFVQADSSTTRKFGGTGLGLAICRQLVGLMGGRISVVSRSGQGSTFTVMLPFAAPAREPSRNKWPATATA
jgi:hypothetical protein